MIGACGSAPLGGRRLGNGVLSIPRSANLEPGKGELETMYTAEELDKTPKRQAAFKVSHGQVMKFTSLNVNSLRKPSMHKQIEQYMWERMSH